MRIIAGSAGGIVLESAPKGIRPTMDRVREAIFSSLGDAVPGARVLDLFAGTGALGIEALSRGAASAFFVERDERCCQCIHRNLAKCHLSTFGVVQKGDAFKFLTTIASQPNDHSFDLIFADPPYTKKYETHRGSRGREEESVATAAAQLLCTSSSLPKILSPDGIFVLETFLKFQFSQSCEWIPLREKRMGETLFFLLSKKPATLDKK